MIYIFENNLGREQDHLTNIIQFVEEIRTNSIVLCEDVTKIGIHTDYHNKLQADQLALDYISSNGIEFARTLITTNAKRGASAVKGELMAQLRGFKEYTIMSTNQAPKIIRSCRHTSDLKPIRDKRDDLLRVLFNMFRGEKLIREKRIANSMQELRTKSLLRRTMLNADSIAHRDKMRLTNIREKHNSNGGFMSRLINQSVFNELNILN